MTAYELQMKLQALDPDTRVLIRVGVMDGGAPIYRDIEDVKSHENGATCVVSAKFDPGTGEYRGS